MVILGFKWLRAKGLRKQIIDTRDLNTFVFKPFPLRQEISFSYSCLLRFFRGGFFWHEKIIFSLHVAQDFPTRHRHSCSAGFLRAKKEENHFVEDRTMCSILAEKWRVNLLHKRFRIKSENWYINEICLSFNILT